MSVKNGRGFVLLLSFVLASGSTIGVDAPVGRQPRTAVDVRPNIVYVVMDDMHPRHLNYMTDSLRRLRDLQDFSFLLYPNAYVTTPQCCPSRASTLRGQYAHNTGIIHNRAFPEGGKNGGAVPFRTLGLDQSTLATMLHDGGYATSMVGKYLNGYIREDPPAYIPPGWDDWHVISDTSDGAYGYSLSEDGEIVKYGYEPEDYLNDVLAQRAADAVRDADPAKPLFLFFSPYAPHVPSIPAPRHAGLYPTLRVPRNPAYLETDVTGKPAWIQELEVTEEDIDAYDLIYRNGARTLRAVDESIQAVVDALDATGRLDTTFFIFHNDNGAQFLEHRWAEKRVPYSASTQVFFAVASKDPKLIQRTGMRRQLIATNIDIGPTIAHLTGTTPDHVMDGVSIMPTFQSRTQAVRTDLLNEYFAFTDPPPPSRIVPSWSSVVTTVPGHWKYVEWATGERELYQLRENRFELENVVSAPENAELVLQLAERLQQLRNQ